MQVSHWSLNQGRARNNRYRIAKCDTFLMDCDSFTNMHRKTAKQSHRRHFFLFQCTFLMDCDTLTNMHHKTAKQSHRRHFLLIQCIYCVNNYTVYTQRLKHEMKTAWLLFVICVLITSSKGEVLVNIKQMFSLVGNWAKLESCIVIR